MVWGDGCPLGILPMPRSLALSAAFLLSLSLGVRADDWPQWLGPTRDATWKETGILTELPKDGPKVLWRKPIGPGYTGPAVAGGKVYVMDRITTATAPADGRPGDLPGKERVLCLDMKTGETVWTHEYDCPYIRISYPQGPRTTPVVADGKVYTLGTMGDMLCLDAGTGKVVWAVNFVKDFALKPPVWGYSAHLLLDKGKLYTLVGGEGGAVRAFDAKTGKELWKALYSQEVGYAPPVLAEAGGKTQLIVWLSDLLAGLNPDSGEVYWKLKHPDLPAGKTQMRPAVSIVTPRVVGDMVYVSTAYEGAAAVRLDKEKPTAQLAWKCTNSFPKPPEKLATLMTTILAKDDHLYCVGTDGKVLCVRADTGAEVWNSHTLYGDKDTLFGTSFWVTNGDRVYMVNDLGVLVIAKLSPKGYEEVSRAPLIDATFSTRGRKVVWAHPAFADKCIVMRNDKEIVCASLAKG